MNPAPSLAQIVEALLFASPEPLTTAALVRAIQSGAAQEMKEAGNDEEVESDSSAEEQAALASERAASSERTLQLESDGDDPEPSPPSEPRTPASAFRKIAEADVVAALAGLVATYQAEGRAFTLQERISGWRVFTRPEYGTWVRGLFPDRKAQRLSQPALETLAIIAYRQPITKAAIEAVRGVSIDGPIQRLLDQNLVRIAGRADLPGRPLLYETTDLFFDHFGIRSIDDLPNASELRRVALPQPEAEKIPDAAPAPEPEAPAQSDQSEHPVATSPEPEPEAPSP